jgi:hypothetical protein
MIDDESRKLLEFDEMPKRLRCSVTHAAKFVDAKVAPTAAYFQYGEAKGLGTSLPSGIFQDLASNSEENQQRLK